MRKIKETGRKFFLFYILKTNLTFVIIKPCPTEDTGDDEVGIQDIEALLARHCAPTFRGLKAANLVAFPAEQRAALCCFLAASGKELAQSGIAFRWLLDAPDRILVLFYRPAALSRRLCFPQALHILSRYGYPQTSALGPKLAHLSGRLRREADFPHEIGLFLGYPPWDVAGFIAHRGRDFLCCGCWKVYAKERAARASFARYQACTAAFCQELRQGVPLTDLLRAV